MIPLPGGALWGVEGGWGSLPNCWGEHGLELGYPSVDGDQELHVVEGHSGCHGIRVVLVIYAQVGAGGLAPPVHGQVQRSGLKALGRHLTKRQEREYLRLGP